MDATRSAPLFPLFLAVTLLTLVGRVEMAPAQHAAGSARGPLTAPGKPLGREGGPGQPALVVAQASGGAAQGTTHGASASRRSPYAPLLDALVEIWVTHEGGLWQGSGFFVDRKGTILTNHHVVGAASSVIVKLSNGQRVYGTVIARRPAVDVAVVSVTETPPGWLPLAETVDKGDVGAAVLALGAPQGLAATMTRGIVSQVRDVGGNLRLVQTDAPINRGNSGGPLILADCGGVIGIVTFGFKKQEFEGLNFAVSIDTVRSVIPQHLSGAPAGCQTPAKTAATSAQPDPRKPTSGVSKPTVPPEGQAAGAPPKAAPSLRPASGTVLARQVGKGGGRGELTVSNHLHQDAIVSLREVGRPNQPYLVFFVRAGDRSSFLDIADGEYELEYTIGDGWQGSEFGQVQGSFMLRHPLAFEAMPIVLRGAQGARTARVPGEGWAVILKEDRVQPSAPPSRSAPRRKER